MNFLFRMQDGLLGRLEGQHVHYEVHVLLKSEADRKRNWWRDLSGASLWPYR